MVKVCVGLVVATAVACVIGCSSSGGGFSAPPAPEEEVAEAPKKPKPATPPAASATSTSQTDPTAPPAPPSPEGDGGSPPGRDSGGGSCQDTTPEPGGSEATAYALPAIDDCDGSQATVKGIAAGMFDVDVYKFQGNDTYLCRIDPKVSITAPGLRLCEFIQCKAGTTTIASCGTGTAATSKTGLKGCCVDGPAEMSIDFDCASAWDDSANFYLQVDQPKADLCVPYSVTYSL